MSLLCIWPRWPYPFSQFDSTLDSLLPDSRTTNSLSYSYLVRKLAILNLFSAPLTCKSFVKSLSSVTDQEYLSFSRTWNPSLWNVTSKGIRTPLSQFQWEGRNLTLVSALLQDAKLTLPMLETNDEQGSQNILGQPFPPWPSLTLDNPPLQGTSVMIIMNSTHQLWFCHWSPNGISLIFYTSFKNY